MSFALCVSWRIGFSLTSCSHPQLLSARQARIFQTVSKINLLKLRYDDIIIDSPPIHLVTDSLIISRVASAALYIVRQGYTHKSELEFISEIKASERFNKFTIVFNGVKRDASGYGYYGGYGYGYSYYNAYTDKPKWNIGDTVKGFLKRF